MWNWVVNVGSVVLISTIATLILPDGRLTGLVGVVLAVIIVFAIIKPLKNLDLFKFNNGNDVESSIEIDNSYGEYLNYLRCQNLITECREQLEEIGIESSNVDIVYDENNFRQFTVKNVKVFLSKEVINSNGEHIDIIDDVKLTISKYVGVKKGEVNVVVE